MQYGLLEMPRAGSWTPPDTVNEDEEFPGPTWDLTDQMDTHDSEGDNFFGDGPFMGTGTAFDTDEEPPLYTPPPG